MSAQYHNGHWYGGGQDIDIQSDPTATSFESGKVPTGDTVQSVLNSNFVNYTYCGGVSTVNTATDIAIPNNCSNIFVGLDNGATAVYIPTSIPFSVLKTLSARNFICKDADGYGCGIKYKNDTTVTVTNLKAGRTTSIYAV